MAKNEVRAGARAFTPAGRPASRARNLPSLRTPLGELSECCQALQVLVSAGLSLTTS